MIERDTIFALSSGRPPAAISVIRISGPKAHDVGRLLVRSLPDARVAAVRSLRDPHLNELLDHALVLRFDSPASVTGENMVEFHCHGGRAVVDAIIGALTSFEGLRLAEPGEFTRRSFDNGRIDLTEAEGLADLIEAETQAQRKAALALAEGGLKRQIASWQRELLALSASAERLIDYDEEDDEVDAALQHECKALASELDGWLRQPRAEPLKDGVRVVLAGPPNIGKSSLLNAMCGIERAIVTAVPGTTRDHIEVPLAIGGIPVLLTDTAGLRQTSDEIELIGIERTSALMDSADVLLWLGDPGSAPSHPQLIRVHSKADLHDRSRPAGDVLPVSAHSGEGIPALLKEVERRARGLLPSEDAIALNRRQARHIEEAAHALWSASHACEVVLVAEELRHARMAFNRLTGSAGVEDVLDVLFSRFCLGK